MSKPETGGSAFPILPPIDSDGRSPAGYPFPDNGMSLRQWYAGKALPAVIAACAHEKNVLGKKPEDVWAEISFAVADAMIARGEK